MNCLRCEEPILPGERADVSEPMHRECAIRSVVGSVGHQIGECSCYGGSREDPPGLSKREAAQAASALFSEIAAIKERHSRRAWGGPIDSQYASVELFAWIGEDELGSGEIGLKQAYCPAGYIPLVAVSRAKMEQSYLVDQMNAQAARYGKKIRLARFVFAGSLRETPE